MERVTQEESERGALRAPDGGAPRRERLRAPGASSEEAPPTRAAALARVALLTFGLALSLRAQEPPTAPSDEPAARPADPRIAAVLARAAKEGANQERGETERLDDLLFALGTLPELDPRELLRAWRDETGEAKAALALALIPCADAAAIEELASAAADPALRVDHAYAHVLACVRALGIESSLPSLRDLGTAPQRARIVDDLRRVNAATRGDVARSRTQELLLLAERAEGGPSAPGLSRALLELAIGVCGRVDAERALALARAARAAPEPALRHALWVALATACARSFLEPEPEAGTTPDPGAIDAALERAEAYLAERRGAAAGSWVEEGFAAAGFALGTEPAARCAALLEASERGTFFLRFHALRSLAAEAGMHPDLDLAFFPERAQRHPSFAVRPPAAREARLREALRAWAVARWPEIGR